MDKFKNKKQFDFSSHDQINLGVLSDTHSFINPYVLEHLSGSDLVIHAGDIGSISVIKQLEQVCNVVIPVCGNNDNLEQWDTLEHLELHEIPQIAEIELPGGTITVTHGDEYFIPNTSSETWHERLRDNFPTAKAIIYGHSHKMVCDQSISPWVLNPGAAGETRIQRNGISCLLIDANQQEWSVSEFQV